MGKSLDPAKQQKRAVGDFIAGPIRARPDRALSIAFFCFWVWPVIDVHPLSRHNVLDPIILILHSLWSILHTSKCVQKKK